MSTLFIKVNENKDFKISNTMKFFLSYVMLFAFMLSWLPESETFFEINNIPNIYSTNQTSHRCGLRNKTITFIEADFDGVIGKKKNNKQDVSIDFHDLSKQFTKTNFSGKQNIFSKKINSIQGYILQRLIT